MANTIAAATPAAPSRAGWLVVAVLLLVQFGLFRQLVQREIASDVPYAFDQAAYLADAYDDYFTALDRGPWAALTQSLARPLPVGCLLQAQANVAFLVLGPSRFAALLPHFLYFAAFQCLVVAVLLRWTRRWEAAFFGLGLLLCAGTTLHWLGGLLDFRIDGIAFSLYGILLGLCLLSDGFASRRWSLAIAGVAALLFLFRYLTIVYLAGIMALWVAFVLARLLSMGRDHPDRPVMLRRLGNAALATLIVMAVVIPVVTAQRKLLWNYYGVGHLTGGEKNIRAVEAGVFTKADSLLYYARSVWEVHAGRLFFAVGALGVALSVVLWRRKTAQGTVSLAAWVLAGVGLLVPWLVLTANTAKSPLVGNVLVAALVWLFLLPLARSAGAWPAWLLRGAAAVALTAGFATLVEGSCRRMPNHGSSEDRQQILAMHDDMAEYSRKQGWKEVRISSDTLIDFLPHVTRGVPAFERQGLRLCVLRELGGIIFAMDDEKAHAAVLRSHFVILRDGEPLTAPAFPIAETLARVRPWMVEYCRSRLEPVATYEAHNGRFTLYARPSLRPSLTEKEWITSQGMRLDGRSATLRRFPHIRLSGEAARQHLPRHPKVEVTLLGAGGEPAAWTIPATVSFPDNGHYHVDFELPTDRLPTADVMVTLRVNFDVRFVPKQKGINEDVRELVVFGPSQVELHRRGFAPSQVELQRIPPGEKASGSE